MSPRTGRPKIENPMNERVSVRLDKDSAETLKRYCETAKVDKAEAIRYAISKLKSEPDKK
ncbi:MAG: ribbon-helix-helix protein, CopG family [Ruminococcaceae bacterium]|nr:ribbon-helix-helix protein, CopG family [Oscillospiraceae bacterium]